MRATVRKAREDVRFRLRREHTPYGVFKDEREGGLEDPADSAHSHRNGDLASRRQCRQSPGRKSRFDQARRKSYRINH
eukprot:2925213-Pleurochrysis_carterae.AAC.1